MRAGICLTDVSTNYYPFIPHRKHYKSLKTFFTCHVYFML
jgi:hypothetical protein